MKRTLLYSTIILAIALVAVASHFWPAKARAAGFTPFTGSFAIVSYNSNGVPVRTDMRANAVRSDGSSVELFYRDPSNSARPNPMRIIKNLQSQQTINVVPFLKAKTTYSISPKEAAKIAPVTSCSGSPAGVMLGHDVVKAMETRPGPQGSGVDRIEFIKWSAPDLDCVPLRMETTVFRNGQPSEHVAQTYISVVEGEPDKELFDVPADYQEEAPTKVMAEAEEMFPANASLHCNPQCSLAVFDEVYRSRSKNLKSQP